MLNSGNKIASKYVTALYRILSKDILTSLVLDYRDYSIITFYFVVLGIIIPKIRSIRLLSHKNLFLKS